MQLNLLHVRVFIHVLVYNNVIAKCKNDAEFVCTELGPSLAVMDDDIKNPLYDSVKVASDESKHISF